MPRIPVRGPVNQNQTVKLMKKGYEQLVAEANAEIETVDVAAAMTMLSDDHVVFVDLRDIRELERDGKIPGAFHAPRGMLEFWVDPESPYHRDVFASGKKFLFYCGSGWRSALATKAVQDMGLAPVCHLGGGYKAWRESDGDTESVSG